MKESKVNLMLQYKRSIPISLVLAILSSISLSAEDDLLSSLENDMKVIEEQAKENKQNIDYKPYIISVLRHDNLKKLGVNNLREALKLVPGVDISVGMMGVTYPVFRGSNPYSMGQSQLYIDGRAVNDAIFNGYYHYLDMPTEIIERIEVIRGSGSFLPHANAYGGSINVITKTANPLNTTQEIQVFGGVGQNGYRLVGTQLLTKQGEWFIGADAYYQDSDRHNFEGPDYLGNSREAYFNNENYAAAINLRDENWQIGGRFVSQITGPSYGQMFTLSEDMSDTLDIKTNNLNVTYNLPLSSDTVLKASAEYLDQRRRLQNKTLPDGQMMMGVGKFSNGRYFYVDYEEQKLSALLQLENHSFSNLDIIAGIKKTRFTNEHDDTSMTTPDGSMMPIMHKDLLLTDKRDITSLYAEATYTPVDSLSVAAGFKYDDISDHGKEFSPRLSTVYLLDSNNIFKAMATRSYRVPSWREKYFFNAPQNLNQIDIEKVASVELSYIHKTNRNDSFRFNLFYLKNKDQVEINPIGKELTDIYDTTIKGVEFEMQYALNNDNDLAFNYSFADGEIDDRGVKIPNSAKHMAMLSNLYHYSDKLTTGTILKYVGEKARDIDDTRSDLDNYITWDQSLQFNNYKKNYSITLTVQNVLDETYHLPASLGINMMNKTVATYPNDFEQPGRNIWIKFEKRWN